MVERTSFPGLKSETWGTLFLGPEILKCGKEASFPGLKSETWGTLVLGPERLDSEMWEGSRFPGLRNETWGTHCD